MGVDFAGNCCRSDRARAVSLCAWPFPKRCYRAGGVLSTEMRKRVGGGARQGRHIRSHDAREAVGCSANAPCQTGSIHEHMATSPCPSSPPTSCSRSNGDAGKDLRHRVDSRRRPTQRRHGLQQAGRAGRHLHGVGVVHADRLLGGLHRHVRLPRSAAQRGTEDWDDNGARRAAGRAADGAGAELDAGAQRRQSPVKGTGGMQWDEKVTQQLTGESGLVGTLMKAKRPLACGWCLGLDVGCRGVISASSGSSTLKNIQRAKTFSDDCGVMPLQQETRL
mmetsp:Transcript_3132/g.5873  ORF Transcript_3132/g.5873 Transcript_3132/m.5873 type:complete len:278 (-) Transcript_3132:33-866(-)